MYDVLVIGAGHAGVEASVTASNQGKKTALLTYSKNDISSLPCNVSIGGSAKGILVREIFALGGIMPIAADNTQLQTKVLNISKGPAVQALRAQVDKVEYPKWVTTFLENSDIDILEGEVTELIISDGKVTGVIQSGKEITSKVVILATGTFLDSKIITGKDIIQSGPDGKKTNTTISKQLNLFGHTFQRLKTGTPPRIKIDSIDLNALEEEPGSDDEIFFSEKQFVKKEFQNIPAWLGYTNKDTHKIIQDSMSESYLYNDEIVGEGPRYCPSIEDKVSRFKDKDRHQIFLEIESEKLDSMYLSGYSSSMPNDIQEKMLKTIKGFENGEFIKYAYAIEYDAVNPIELNQSLESKKIKNLFFAGQINGTSGYEEAAAQGLVAGLNASRKIDNNDPIIFRRDESYIGVMIDDITTKGVIDPYRLLTSRSEYRLLLRSDNAVKRLYEKAYDFKLITQQRFNELKVRFDSYENVIKDMHEIKVNYIENKNFFDENNILIKQDSIRLFELIKRPEFNIHFVKDFIPIEIKNKYKLSNEDFTSIGIEIKFEGYILRQKKEIKNYLRYQKIEIPENINYKKIPNLSGEAIEKLTKYLPNNIYQASNISGINPSDIMSLMLFLNGGKHD